MSSVKALKKSDKIIKRLFDFLLSLTSLIVLFPIIIATWILSSIDTNMNGFYFQKRIGRNAVPFNVIKIRTMKPSKLIKTNVTSRGDERITNIGSYLRYFKIDELPQLFNILKGDMSFVGPRPDVEGFADLLSGSDRIILDLRPGITGPASLKYRNEEEILEIQTNPESFNRDTIWPDKVRINKEYIKNYNFLTDIKILLITILGLNYK
jgi:lipopolysaccharide/colanic/teichoic acid biosynthesis glycosyltransferase